MYNVDDLLLLEWSTHACLFMKKLGILGEFFDYLINEKYNEKTPLIKNIITEFHEYLVKHAEDYNNRTDFLKTKINEIDFATATNEEIEDFLMNISKEYIEGKKDE